MKSVLKTSPKDDDQIDVQLTFMGTLAEFKAIKLAVKDNDVWPMRSFKEQLDLLIEHFELVNIRGDANEG